MLSKQFTFAAVAAAIIPSLMLSGSARPAAPPNLLAKKIGEQGGVLFSSSRFSEAHNMFLRAASLAESTGDTHTAAMNLTNASGVATVELQFRAALNASMKSCSIAERSGDSMALGSCMNNLANLYIQMGQPENALRVAHQALTGPGRRQDVAARMGAKLKMQLAKALMQLHRYDEALPVYREAIAELLANKDFTVAARALSSLGDESLKANRLEEASASLNEGLGLVNSHHADALPSILDGLGKLSARQGNYSAARAFFDQALALPFNGMPRWKLFADRARFRLTSNDLQSAMDDFREARRIALRMRVDVVPADQDRVSLESGLSDVAQGLVETGNRLARSSGNSHILEETFDAAEQDRQWSLRALVPGVGDWRSRLPEAYWGMLARYQALERTAIAKATPEAAQQASVAGDELKRMEVQAGQTGQGDSGDTALAHVRTVLDKDAVLLSFHLSRSSCWIWATDKTGTSVFPLPSLGEIEKQSLAFTRAVHEGANAVGAGRTLYATLFGGVPENYLAHRKWLLEPDGALYFVPFAALVVNKVGAEPVYLVEKATLQSVPGALLLRKDAAPLNPLLLAIGDAVYNGADKRYVSPGKMPELTLPRLPNTAAELATVQNAWGTANTRLLIGQGARSKEVTAAIARNPGIIHFATHVVPSPGDFRTGLIALSLDENGAMGMLGPREILARPIGASLVVMDGCHSAQAEALPGAGLMGLTRAWIGAGAASVLATQWDIADTASQAMMDSFYRAMARHVEGGAAGALREAQIASLHTSNGRLHPSAWAGYSLESLVQ